MPPRPSSDRVADPLDPEAIPRKEFRSTFRGYDQLEVKAYLTSVSVELAAFHERAAAATGRAEAAERRLEAIAELDDEQITEMMGERTAHILSAARQTASDIEAEAIRRAQSIRAESESDARSLSAEARGELDRQLEEGAQVEMRSMEDAERALSEGRRQVAEELEEARRQGRLMIDEARRVRDRMIKDLARQRRVAQRQHEQVSSLQRELLERLSVVSDGVAASQRSLEALAIPSLVDDAVLPVDATDATDGTVVPDNAGPYDEVAVGASVEDGATVDDSIDAGPADDTIDLRASADETHARGSDGSETADNTGIDVVGWEVVERDTDPAGQGHDRGRSEIDSQAPAPVAVARPTPSTPHSNVLVLGPIETSEDAADSDNEDTSTSEQPPSSEPAVAAAKVFSLDDARDANRRTDTDGVPLDHPALGLDHERQSSSTPSSTGATTTPDGADRQAVPRDSAVVADQDESHDAELVAGRAGDDEVGALFARIRAGSQPRETTETDSGGAGAGIEGGAMAPVAGVAAARADALDGLERKLARRLKRMLSDDQNDVLDRLRRIGALDGSDAVLPTLEEHADRYGSEHLVEVQRAVKAGAGLFPASTEVPADLVDALVAKLVAGVVTPLHSGLREAIDLAAGDDDEATAGVRACYRTVKLTVVRNVAESALLDAFGQGVYAALPADSPVRWVAVEPSACGEDCQTNDAAEPRVKGEDFPSGVQHPPAHAGCRCLVVPGGAP